MGSSLVTSWRRGSDQSDVIILREGCPTFMIWTTPGFEDLALRLLPSSSYCPLSLSRISVGVRSLHCTAPLSSRATVEPNHSFRRSILQKNWQPRFLKIRKGWLNNSCAHDQGRKQRSCLELWGLRCKHLGSKFHRRGLGQAQSMHSYVPFPVRLQGKFEFWCGSAWLCERRTGQKGWRTELGEEN